MKINDLPIEILMKIFSYLPSYDNVSLVNKQFYTVMCILCDPTTCLTLNSDLFEEKEKTELLQSIKDTNRQIRNVRVFLFNNKPEALRTTIAIIAKFSATIKYLKFQGSLELTEFMDILSLVPNAEHLVFEFVRPSHAKSHPSPGPLEKKRRRIISSSNGDLNLHQLKTLTFKYCADEIVDVFNRLPEGVLTELELGNLNLDKFRLLFTRQKNIKKLTIKWLKNGAQEPMVSGDICDNQQLEYLEWFSRSFTLINADVIVSKQKNLKSLNLVNTIVGESLMNAVMNQLTELETLVLNLTETPIAVFQNIWKLKKLKDLTLRSFDGFSTPFETFATLNNSTITTLVIQNILFDMSADLIASLSKSVPNLKVLRFTCGYSFSMFNMIMRNFNFVEILQLNESDGFHAYYLDDDRNNTLTQGNCFNPKLIELKITYRLPFKRPLLEKFIQDYPNLKKLVINSCPPIAGTEFKLILDGFKKMESLTLRGVSLLTIDDLDYLKVHRAHLKFISLKDLDEIKVAALHKQRLSEIFDVVKFDITGVLDMAIDRKTMKSERM